MSARERVAYYEKSIPTEDVPLFEKRYTAYSDRGIMDYVRDVLTLLCEEELLGEDEIKPLWELIQRADKGISIWSSKGAEPWS